MNRPPAQKRYRNRWPGWAWLRMPRPVPLIVDKSKKPRKSWISPDCWSLIQRTQSAKRALSNYFRWQRCWLFSVVFYHWRCFSPCKYNGTHRTYVNYSIVDAAICSFNQSLLSVARARKFFNWCKRTSQKAIRIDKQSMIHTYIVK